MENTNTVQIIRDLVGTYKKGYRQLTNEEVLDIRSDLSIALFDLVNSKLYERLINGVIDSGLLYEKTRAEVYKEYYEDNGATAARELYKADSKYLHSKRDKDMSEKKLKIVEKIIAQAREVLNSIASKVR